MAGNIVEDSGERTYANRIMLNGCQSKMATSLSGDFVAQHFERFS